MKCIVCLGNPGKKYHYTRHNIGFLVGDTLVQDWSITGEKQQFKSLCSSIKKYDQSIYILKPLTFMNLSGQAVVDFISFYKCKTEDLLVIYDDIDIDFGRIRYRSSGSPGTHNGLRSIVNLLGSDNVPRLRVGIGPKPNTSLADFVLNSFTDKEQLSLSNITRGCVDFLDVLFTEGDVAAMNTFNNHSFLI